MNILELTVLIIVVVIVFKPLRKRAGAILPPVLGALGGLLVGLWFVRESSGDAVFLVPVFMLLGATYGANGFKALKKELKP